MLLVSIYIFSTQKHRKILVQREWKIEVLPLAQLEGIYCPHVEQRQPSATIPKNEGGGIPLAALELAMEEADPAMLCGETPVRHESYTYYFSSGDSEAFHIKVPHLNKIMYSQNKTRPSSGFQIEGKKNRGHPSSAPSA